MKKKILLLSDDIRTSTGVANISKEIVLGTVNHFDWVQIGAMMNHPDIGKIIDLSEDIKNNTGISNANVKIYPNNGYGDIHLLRKIIEIEKPDAILHFTDPHYWGWLYEHEYEIRQKIPILYYHVWDNIPTPYYNKDYYNSCDWIGCISKLTFGVVNRIKNDLNISYIPHGINSEVFKPITIDEDIIINGVNLNNFNFILFYNSRNIKRKQPIDVMLSFKSFCDILPINESSKCLLLMNTQSIDWTDLNKVYKDVCPNYNILFTNTYSNTESLNKIYNKVDCTISISSNEGFGLSTAESLMSGTPIIVNVTGGLQDQCGFEYNEYDFINLETLSDEKYKNIKHGEWAFPIWSKSHVHNGSVSTPYIMEDYVNIFDVSLSIKKVYDLDKEKRKEIGFKGRDYMLKYFNSKKMCLDLTNNIFELLEKWTPKNKLEIIKL